MGSPDWKAGGKQEAEGVLIRRLDFPVKELVYTPGSDRVEIRLGQPTTTQRDIQPLRRGQEVFIVVPVRITGTHTRSFAFIEDVGEGVIWVAEREMSYRLHDGHREAVLIRLQQHVSADEVTL